MDIVNVELFGQDLKIQKAISVAKNVAVTKAPVLIVGEAGIGKKTLAMYVHQNSTRAQKPFCVVDCSDLPVNVENSILGHRDEFTGNFNRGILERANGGTVVFANIDGLDEEFQKKLHKILNELNDYDIDVRLIATTSKNLSKLVGAGKFYRGLYNMVCVNTFHMPPLRERQADLEYMVKHFLDNLRDDLGREVVIEDSAMMKIKSHYWSNNVGELKSVIEDSARHATTGYLSEENLIIGEKKSANVATEEDSDGIKLMSLKDAEKMLIKKALTHTSENRTQAAKILGVSIRTLRNKINEYRNEGNSYFVNLR